MRWAALFEDLEAQLATAGQLDMDSEISDRARMEQAAVKLVDRLRGQLGGTLKVRVSGHEDFEGRLVHVGSEWLVLESGSQSMLIPFSSATVIHGLGRSTSATPSFSDSRLKLTSALRVLSRDRAPLSVQLVGTEREGSVNGIIDRVGSDFIEVAVVPSGEYRRARNVVETVAVPLHAVRAVVSQR
ncbi:hypothetical protein [Arthrobacter monumenti]